MLSVFRRLENIDGSIKKMDDRVDEIENHALTRGQKIVFTERLFWIVVTGAVGLTFIFLR